MPNARCCKLVVEFADIRILAFGVLNRPRSSLSVNANASTFLYPPGLQPADTRTLRQVAHPDDNGESEARSGILHLEDADAETRKLFNVCLDLSDRCRKPAPPRHSLYDRMTHPIPAPSHALYPWFTPGGGDRRWITDDFEEEGMQWVGGLM